MKRIIFISILSISFINIGHADIWTDGVKYQARKYSSPGKRRYKNKMSFGPQWEVQARPQEIQWFKFKGKAESDGNDCGGRSFKSQLGIEFNKNALNDYLGGLKGAVKQMLAGAPMFLLQQVSPNIAEAIKHIKAMANISLKTRMGQCQEMFKAASNIGRKIFASGKADCVNKTMNDQIGMGKAIENCSDANQRDSWFPAIKEGAAKYTNNVTNFSQDMLDTANDKFKSMQGTIGGDFINMFGTTELKSDGETKFSTNPVDKVDKELRSKADEIRKKGMQALADIRAGKEVTLEIMEELSTPGSPMSIVILEEIAMMDDDKAEVFLNNVANNIAYYKKKNELLKHKHMIVTMGRLPNVKKYEEAGLANMDKILKMIDNDIQRLDSQIELEEKYADNLSKMEAYLEAENELSTHTMLNDFHEYNRNVDGIVVPHGSILSARKNHVVSTNNGLP